MVFTCSRCGYATNDKGRINAHMNRKFPCKEKQTNKPSSNNNQNTEEMIKRKEAATKAVNKDDEQVDIERLSSERSTKREKNTANNRNPGQKQPQQPVMQQQHSNSRNENTSSDSSEEDGNTNNNTVVNNRDIDLNIRIDYKLLLREDLGELMNDILNEPNNIDAFKELYQIKVPIRRIHEEYPYQKIILMFEDYIMFMYARKTIKTYTEYDHKNTLLFAPALFHGIYLNAVIKSESGSTSYLSKILSRGMKNDDNEANEEEVVEDAR